MLSNFGYNTYHTMLTYWSWWSEADNERDELVRVVLTIPVPTLVLAWYKWTLMYTRKPKYPLPPGPYSLPLVGYLPFLRSNLHEIYTEMAHKYGPIFSIRLGSKLHVVVNSVDLVKVVARDLGQTFANRIPTQAALTISYDGLNIVWSNKTYWRNMRKLLVSQVMNNANLNTCQSIRTHEVRKMVKEIYTNIGTKVDINEIAFETVLNIVTSMLWGKSGDILDGFREVDFKIIELLGARDISDFIPMLSWFDLQGRQREMLTQRLHLDRIFGHMIKARMTANSMIMKGAVEEERRKDFLQIMLELKDQNPTSFDVDHMKAILLDAVVAATDTTSAMVEWVMAEILHNPGVMRKVQDELTMIIGMNNIVEESHLPKLTYLDAVIKETFRLHPPLPLLLHRSPDESCMVDGYTVPKGSIVNINVWAIHRDPQNWTNPLEFNPERFLNGKWDYNGNNLRFIPFGSGRRICPGIPLGEKMLMYILASLLHSFDWSLPKDEELELSDEFAFVTKKRKPLKAIPSQRLAYSSLNL